MKFEEAKIKALENLSSPEFKKRVISEDETMLKHFGLIKKINNAGFLTTESQAGNKESGINPETKKRFEVVERAYMCGFMLESDAVDFIKNMGIYTDKNAMFIPVCSNDVYVPKALDIPVTILKSDGKYNGNWDVPTSQSSVYPLSYWNQLRKELHLNKSEKIVYVFCWDTKWKRNASGSKGLFTDILKILKMK